jgi:hypothetical protein
MLQRSIISVMFGETWRIVMRTEVAFALAGLGGVNAHGAGFLAAASKNGVVPDLVTATSGQIIVLSDWLQKRDLKASLIDPRRENDPFAQLRTAFFGYPGVFEPAYWQTISRWLTPPAPNEDPAFVLADRILPAQQYVPARKESFFEEIADTFNNRAEIDGNPIGVLFNAYDISKGTGALYGNSLAKQMLPKKRSLARQPQGPIDVHYHKDNNLETVVNPITPEAIKGALWLSLYGFEKLPGGKLDGAYHRSCLVSELHQFSRIFVARPLANGWVGRLPRNWFEVQDWQCEMWFSVGYKAEVDAMKRINDLIEQHHLKDDKFRKVDLVEIEPETPVGYFNYFIEHEAVYNGAFAKADEAFREFARARNTVKPPAP